jgi:hypothetical protein
MKSIVAIGLFFCFGIAEGADKYVRDESLDSSAAYLVDEIDVAPKFLVERFGAPGEGDGLRVSGCFTFRSEDAVVFTIHDYKSTTLWATDEGPADSGSLLEASQARGVIDRSPRT